jgi:hypothetical protein
VHSFLPAHGFFLRVRVGAVVDRHEVIERHLGVDLRRRQRSVAEELLDRAQVGAAVEEMGGVGVAQRVRRHRRHPASAASRRRWRCTERGVRRPPRALRKSGTAAAAAQRDVGIDRRHRLAVERDETLLAALAAAHLDERAVPVALDVAVVEAAALRDAQPRAVEELGDGATRAPPARRGRSPAAARRRGRRHRRRARAAAPCAAWASAPTPSDRRSPRRGAPASGRRRAATRACARWRRRRGWETTWQWCRFAPCSCQPAPDADRRLVSRRRACGTPRDRRHTPRACEARAPARPRGAR